MDKNSFYISVGIWIVVLQFMGVPSTWKTALTIFSALIVILINLSPIILKKVQNKTPRTRKKAQTISSSGESSVNVIGKLREFEISNNNNSESEKTSQELRFNEEKNPNRGSIQ